MLISNFNTVTTKTTTFFNKEDSTMIHNLQNTQQDHKWLKPHPTFIPATPPCIPTPITYYFPGSHYHIQHHSTPAVKV